MFTIDPQKLQEAIRLIMFGNIEKGCAKLEELGIEYEVSVKKEDASETTVVTFSIGGKDYEIEDNINKRFNLG